MHIPGGDRLWVGQLLSEDDRYPDLVGVDAGVRGDNRTSGVVDSFAHHVHAEQPFLLLQ